MRGGNCAIYGCSFLRTTEGVLIHKSNTGGKLLLQLLLVKVTMQKSHFSFKKKTLRKRDSSTCVFL